jgi:hypothetical protein
MSGRQKILHVNVQQTNAEIPASPIQPVYSSSKRGSRRGSDDEDLAGEGSDQTRRRGSLYAPTASSSRKTPTRVQGQSSRAYPSPHGRMGTGSMATPPKSTSPLKVGRRGRAYAAELADESKGTPSPDKFRSPKRKRREPLLCIEDFVMYTQLGQGGFGTVYLARHIKSQLMYAIKAIPKLKIVESQTSVDFTIREGALLQDPQLRDHPKIVALCFSFQSRDHVFLGFRFMEGGNLYSLCSRVRSLCVCACVCVPVPVPVPVRVRVPVSICAGIFSALSVPLPSHPTSLSLPPFSHDRGRRTLQRTLFAFTAERSC